MATLGFARFLKQFASGTSDITPLTDAQAAAGWDFLGTSPPTVGQFNAIMQSFDDKDNWLFQNIVTLQTGAGVAAPSDGDFTTLYKAVIALLVNGITPPTLTGNTGTAYSLANANPIAAYANAQKFRAVVNVVNGVNPTLKVDALTAIPIFGLGASALQGQEMPINAIATFEILISATVNGGNPVAVLQEAAGGASQIANGVLSQHAVALGQALSLQGNYSGYTVSGGGAISLSQLQGNVVAYTGASGGSITLPAATTLVAGKASKIVNFGAGTLVVQVNATEIGDYLYNGLVTTLTSITLQRGDDLEIVGRGTFEIDMIGGSALRQYYPLVVGPATSPTHAVQLQQVGHGQCRLTVLNSTTLQLIPYSGNNLIINGVPQAVPATGVNVTNAGLIASAWYYVYAYMNAGVMALECSSTAYGLSSSGIRVKTGDPTRTLVGAIYTTSVGTNFADSIGQRFCISMYNRQNKYLATALSNVNFTNTVQAEVTAALRSQFISWGDESVSASVDGEMKGSAAGTSVLIQCYIDTIAGSLSGTYFGTADTGGPASSLHGANVSEGVLHYITAYGSVNGNTGTLLQAYTRGMIRG